MPYHEPDMYKKFILAGLVLLLGAALSARDFNERKIVLNLAVLSDTHVDGYNTVPAYKFRSALVQERDFAARFGGLDGVLLVGDLVDSPAWDAKKYPQIDDWKRLYESVFNPVEVPMVYAVGNHDIWREWTPNTYREAKQFTRRFGPDYYRTDVGDPVMRDSLECRHCVIGGVHILCITPDGRDPVVYPEASLRWLDETLAQITTEHPDQYVLVLTHAMIYHTVYGSELDDVYPKGKGYWSTRVLTPILEKYPQAIAFGGHLHFPLNDPRSIWQGAFTSMGTASVRYMAIDNGGYENMAGLTIMRDKDEFSQGLLLQFDKEGNLRVQRMDFYNQTTIGEPWTLKHPARDGSHLKAYSNVARAAANRAPVLRKLEAEEVAGKLSVRWDAGDDDEFVHTYFVTVTRGDRIVCTKKVLADFYHVPQPSAMKKTWRLDIPLEPGDYTVSLSARDSWGAESNTLVCTCSLQPWMDRPAGFHERYTLEEAVVLSRHNIRSPLSGKGSVLSRITPHDWFEWTSAPGELSLKGGVLETQMGQFFRQWLISEGLIQENERPAEGQMRFYANSMQRTIATAQYFSSGMLPLANVPVEHHCAVGTMDPVFNPQLTRSDAAFLERATAQIRAMGGEAGFAGVGARMAPEYAVLENVLDIRKSPAARNDTTAIPTGDFAVRLELNKEPSMTGGLKMANSASDALVLQYYEEPNLQRAAFGHKISREDWERIAAVKDWYGDVLFTAPAVAANVAHPLLKTILSELETPGRKFAFLCGHDSNIGSVLAALGNEDYEAPQAIERKTPIGSKLVFCKWRGSDGSLYADIHLVYASDQQLREMPMLSLQAPPMSLAIRFKGLTPNADGLLELTALEQRLQEAIASEPPMN